MSVIIGMDPHKRSATIEVIDAGSGQFVDAACYGTDQPGYAAMLDTVRQRFPDRVWAVEGCNGVGRHLAHRLVHDDETVIDVPAKLSAQVRVFATGNGRKSDPVDAHSVALAALHAPSLHRVELDDDLVVLGLLVDRREELGRARTQAINRLHRLLVELIPGGAKKYLSALQARALLATVEATDRASEIRCRLVDELVDELEDVDDKIKALDKEIRALVTGRGSTLMQLTGIGPSGAARLLVDVGDLHRFADRDRFASWNGTAPLDASSGAQQRHRLSRAGNRHINRVLHTMAVVQLRNPTPGRRYYDTRRAAGMASMMALRALKRRLSNVVYARMLTDQQRRDGTGPAGHPGTTTESSVADLTPDIGPSDKPHAGPATGKPKPASSSTAPAPAAPDRRLTAPPAAAVKAGEGHPTGTALTAARTAPHSPGGDSPTTPATCPQHKGCTLRPCANVGCDQLIHRQRHQFGRPRLFCSAQCRIDYHRSNRSTFQDHGLAS